MPEQIALVVNGADTVVAADPDTPLLDLLRDGLGLMGTRPGCLAGQCGACTAHVDGRAVQTCQTPLWSVAGRRIDTIDAPPPGGMVDRVRRAFLDAQAAQCGYCVNGIVMTVAALLAAPERPRRATILATLDERHLCRCGAHPRMLRAIDRLLAEASQ